MFFHPHSLPVRANHLIEVFEYLSTQIPETYSHQDLALALNPWDTHVISIWHWFWPLSNLQNDHFCGRQVVDTDRNQILNSYCDYTKLQLSNLCIPHQQNSKYHHHADENSDSRFVEIFSINQTRHLSLIFWASSQQAS